MLYFVILFFLVPFLCISYLELKHLKHRRILNKLPGAKTLPLLGNAHQMGKNPTEVLNKLFEWYNEFGRTNFRIWIGYYPNVSIVNPKDLEFVLSSSTLIDKSDVYDTLHPWLGLGLLTSTGSKWHKRRKMITPSFHFKILQDFHEIMNANSSKFVQKLKLLAVDDNIFDFQKYVHNFTLDVICETAMGVSINAMENSDTALVKAFKDMCYNINMRAFHPWKRSQRLYRLFGRDYPKFLKTLKILKDFTNEVIKKRIELLQNNMNSSKQETNFPTEEYNDEQLIGDVYSRSKLAFLDTLLTATIDGNALTQDEIYEEVSTFIFEGHDTTSSAVSFAGHLLARHQDVQQKIYEEQVSVMQGNLKRDATYSEIASMKYLDLFIKELLRLYPSVPIIGRLTDQDYDINGTLIPKDTTLNIFLMVLGYDDRVFKDPYRFRPERFVDEKPGPFEYLPFSAGPRNCIGQKFAQLEIKTIVSKIVREFHVLPALDELVSQDGLIDTFIGLPEAEKMRLNAKTHKYTPVLTAVLTLKSENGLHIRLKGRK